MKCQLTEDSPFNSDNPVLVSIEGYAVTIEAHLFDECSEQANHKVFIDEHSDATIFSPESHSALEDEKSEEACDVQAEFGGSMSAVQENLVAKGQDFVLEDFAPILANVQLNFMFLKLGVYPKLHPMLLAIAHAYASISMLLLCHMAPENTTPMNSQVLR